MNPLLPAAAMAACVLLAAAGLQLYRTVPKGARALIEAPSSESKGRPGLSRAVERLGRRFGHRALALMSERRRALIRHRLDAAGRPGGLTLERYARRKAASTILFGGAGMLFLLSNPVLMLAMAGLGWLVVDLRLAKTAKRRQARIDRDLPDFLDVLSVTVGAGLGFRTALDRVADARGGALGEEVRTMLQQMSLGAEHRAAFEALRERNDSEPLGQLVTALLQAEELGTPLTDVLVSIAHDLRREFSQHARREAARAAPRVSLVVTMVVVPGAIVLILAGLFLGNEANIGAILGG